MGEQQQRLNVASMEEIDAYVRELQLSHDGTSRAPPLTVENVLQKVYARFYNQKGQSPFPDGLPFALKQIPSLMSMAMLQSRLTAIIQSAVATRPVVTLHELECEVCLAENVADYAELSLGSSLAVLPFVQHTFNINGKSNIAPVTSADFLQFLLFDPEAQIVLTSGGDAGDAVRVFSRRYMNGKYTPMQLGIHVQHFSLLLQFLRQEVGRVTTFFSQIQSESVRACERNAVMYTRILESIHASFMLRHTNAGTSSPQRVEFVLHASPAEAETTDIPPDLWGVSTGSAGGLCLYGALQAEPFSCRERVVEVAKLTSPAVPQSSCLSPAPDVSTPGTGSNVTFSHARKRRRVTVVDEQTEVKDAVSVSTPFLHAPSQVMAIPPPPPPPPPQTTTPQTTTPLCSIPLEGVASVLRCLAVMRFTGPATWNDFATFRKCASQVLSQLRRGGGNGGTGFESITEAARDLFSVDLETLLHLLSSSGAPEKLHELYCALANGHASVNDEDVPPGRLLLCCLELGLQELLFVPLVGTSSLLPLSAAQGVLRGRVLLSGCSVWTDLFAFHPLHLVFDTFGIEDATADDSGEGGSSLAVVDATVLLRGMCDSLPRDDNDDDEEEEQQQKQKQKLLLLNTLESCGVLSRVPEEWLRNGFLLQLLKKLLRRHRNRPANDDTEGRQVAFRVLLLYWWLLGVWCEAPTSRGAAAVEEFLQHLRDTPWIPCLSRQQGDSDLHVVCWCMPCEMFPSLPCFVTGGLSDLLQFAPHDMKDLLLLSQQQGADRRHVESTRGFLDRWISTVRRRILGTDAESLARLVGMPVTFNASVALRMLHALQVGQHISLSTLRHLLLCIRNTATEDDVTEARQQPIIPLPDAAAAASSSCCVGIAADSNTFVVGEVATCETVCWGSFGVDDDDDDDEERVEERKNMGKMEKLSLFDRFIRFVGDDLRTFFLEVLGVSLVPTVATWVAAARTCRRRVTSGKGVHASLTGIFLHALSRCCRAQYHFLVKTLEQQGADKINSAAQEALHRMVDLVPEIDRGECIFPLNGRWRCASDGLFFCSPYYYGLGGLALGATGDRRAPALPVLMFEEQPHYVVAAVMQKWGLFALENCTEKIVTFGHMNAVSGVDLHQKVAECTPLVQQFLRATHSKYYAVVQQAVRQRLEHFGAVVAAMPMIREALRYQGHRYMMTRGLHVRYVPQHNCLYSADEEFTASVGSDAIADVFLPFSDAAVRHDVVCLLREWLQGDKHRIGDNAKSSARPSMVSPLPMPDDEAWQLSAAPAARFREHFPLGRDGFVLVGRTPATVAATVLGATHAASVRLSAWGNNDHMVRSLPQWRCELFDSAHDVLCKMRRGFAESDKEMGNTNHKNSNSNNNDDDYDDCDDNCSNDEGSAAATGDMSLIPKRLRRGGRSRHAGPAMLMPHEQRETHGYAIAAERFVAEMLRAEAPAGVDVVWVNEHGERGTPYDILVVRHNPQVATARGSSGRAASEEILAFVEVKSTCTNARRDFEMSLRELLFAARFGKAYKIYRVFRASTNVMRKMQVEILQDLVTLWRNGEISMTGDVKVVPSFKAREMKCSDHL